MVNFVLEVCPSGEGGQEKYISVKLCMNTHTQAVESFKLLANPRGRRETEMAETSGELCVCVCVW